MRDIRYVRQPLAAVVLVSAGAHVELSPAIGAAAAGGALLLAAGSHMWKRSGPVVDVTSGIPMGVIAVASALMFVRIAEATFSPLLGAVALGWLAIDMLSLAARRGPHEALA